MISSFKGMNVNDEWPHQLHTTLPLLNNNNNKLPMERVEIEDRRKQAEVDEGGT